ncbi:hypothetical protein ACFQL4_02220 [Halosimplex aquaticum]
MPDPYWCPVDGCDYGEDEEKDRSSVQGHINASASPEHDWSELREQVDAQAEDGEGNGDGEQPDEATGSEESEPSESSDAEDEDSEDGDSTEEDDMASREEYETQHTDGSTDADSDAESGGSDTEGAATAAGRCSRSCRPARWPCCSV